LTFTWRVPLFVGSKSELFSDDAALRWSGQTHIRSPVVPTAPISRVRRGQLRKAGPIFNTGNSSQVIVRSAHLDPARLIRPRGL